MSHFYHSELFLSDQLMKRHLEQQPAPQCPQYGCFPRESAGKQRRKAVVTDPIRANLDTPRCDIKVEAKEKKADIEHLLETSDCDTRVKKMRGKLENSDSCPQHLKLTREQEKLAKKQERAEEQLIRKREKFEERLLKKQEKTEERLLRRQERLLKQQDRLMKQQEKIDRKKVPSKYVRVTLDIHLALLFSTYCDLY